MGVFDNLLSYEFQPSHVPIFFTLILLEGILSFDNAAVLAAMVRKLPVEQRRKALLYGLGGAYGFRIAAILGVAFIASNRILLVLGGLYLIYLAVKHLFFHKPHSEHGEATLLRKLGISGFWGVVIAVELADLAFALDQVLVAVAMVGPTEILLIILASLVAILFLRLSAAYMGRLMDWFPALEKLAYIAVGFVGVKLVIEYALREFVLTETEFHAYEGNSKLVSVAITLSLLIVPILAKAVLDRLRHRSLKEDLVAESHEIQ